MRGSKIFSRGGGDPGPTARKQSRQRFFLFLVLKLVYSLQRGSNDVITEKLYFSKDPEWVQYFQGVQLFLGGGGGVQMLISI